MDADERERTRREIMQDLESFATLEERIEYLSALAALMGITPRALLLYAALKQPYGTQAHGEGGE